MGEIPTVRTFVTFRSDLERVENPRGRPLPAMPDPPGGRIAEYLVGELRSRGLVAMDPRPFEDYCHMIDCACGEAGFEIRVGFIGDEPQEWLIMIDSTLSFIGRLMGKRDAAPTREVTGAVDDALRREAARCSEIRWYTPKEWDAGGESWAEHPVESVSAAGGAES